MKNNDLLIKYFEGKTSSEEREAVLLWIRSSKDNEQYFSDLHESWLFANLPQTRANAKEIKGADQIISRRNKKHIFFRNYSYIISGVAAILLIAFILDIYPLPKDDLQVVDSQSFVSELRTGYSHEIYTNKGVKSVITLPDSSKVWLNSDTRIIFPNKFTGTTRDIYIEGEAYFEVKTNLNQPMNVMTCRGFMVEVVGTKFNLCAYPDQTQAKATLVDGKINLIKQKVDKKSSEIIELNPNESYVIEDLAASIIIPKVNTIVETAWVRGDMIFENTALDQVISKLERWHGTEFTVLDNEIYNTRLTAKFRSESIVQIMEVLGFCTGIDYLIKDNTVTLISKK